MTNLRQAEPPPEWPLVKNILDEYGLDAISFVAEWKAAQRPWQGLTVEERNACLVSADPCEALADPEAKQLMEDIEEKLRSKNT